ncbi:aminoglycoside adenylyltransferase family protein [Aquibaculum arenosum]|uniref:Aminoglycoside (3'') (9) adenylyltransferase n=1 Tax=Aquibaculum arenosum TaxID=3032591 RepID=A0ABT5YRJ1_9PROT|nr:aminoglycoside adenylyltransferase family protein [Fodinicurvata sp. CAU 1616]MDF2096834.1 aminoglycoside adenylyltransferase family protein [Fodinicurvata sp. CAU 1616]
MPAEARQALAQAQGAFGPALMAMYLHGSAVAGGLRPQSDVDLLAVVDQPVTQAKRESLVASLMHISGRHPAAPNGPRPLELLVFHHDTLRSEAYPPRAELVYGEWLRTAFEAGARPKAVVDPEFTLLLAQARREARALLGPDPAELLPCIPEAEIRRAIGETLPALLDALAGDERNVLLTLARMWRTVETGDFVPKDVAADWAIARLPTTAAELLVYARAGYLGERKDEWSSRQKEVQSLANHFCARITQNL